MSFDDFLIFVAPFIVIVGAIVMAFYVASKDKTE
ncbi:cytochrome bd oxidase small subunit CydS [Halalkalibacterium halodurans]|uniref:BH3973 protein n=1 Tax=Halalkalibacterium halodurans (strain ATCC BAA-125 / DSM 18197 / FERM 7344 / JCM 9153 / C-125) TaxID=272558 RepID=Q9K5W4_HALH5|nr:BH3973 [Halalkalibacterium halodurans C-125]